jgi:hypothetical protein
VSAFKRQRTRFQDGWFQTRCSWSCETRKSCDVRRPTPTCTTATCTLKHISGIRLVGCEIARQHVGQVAFSEVSDQLANFCNQKPFVAIETGNHGQQERFTFDFLNIELSACPVGKQCHEGQLRATIAIPKRMNGIQF